MANFPGASLDRLYNLHWVTKEAARSAQPYLGFYATFLKRHGFRSLINLRGDNARFAWWRRETHLCDELGIAHFDVKLNSRKLPPREVLVSLFDAFDEAATPLLLKCSGGQDRASLAAALYLLHKGGAPALGEAIKQFAAWPYLHRPRRDQKWLREFPVFALEDAGELALGQWARTRYDPYGFAAWLEKRGLPRSYGGFQRLKPRPSPPS